MDDMLHRQRHLAITAVVFLALGSLSYSWLFADLPSLDDLDSHLALPSIRVTDRNGRALYDVLAEGGGRHTTIPLHAIPLALQQATLATEDANFYTNPGVDVVGISRAFWINLQGGETLAGGSTLTQQLARLLLLNPQERAERTLRRKLRESWLAWQLARRFSKDENLALYLNQVYYGGWAYGVEAAAQTYFGKPAAQLDLAECALLAGLTQAPAAYNPLTHFEAAKQRQLVVLGLMEKQGFITAAESELAIREPLVFAAAPYPIEAPHFVLMVRDELASLLPPEKLYTSGGLTVRTTLDLDWQHHAEAIMNRQLATLEAHQTHNAALVALNPQTGEVLALVGNADYFNAAVSGAINLAVTPRQPGSALKPFIYAAAFDPTQPGAWSPATVLLDVNTAFTTHEGQAYEPLNFDRQEHGPVAVSTALGSSLNIPAVLALQHIGFENAFRLMHALGFTTLADPNHSDLSFALGGGEVRLTDLTAAYGALANSGYQVTPTLILDITDSTGKQLYAAPAFVPRRVLDERVAWLITDILSDDSARSLAFGAHSLLAIDRPAAAKTGTTTDFHDNWTIGYTPDLVVGVWVGNADHLAMREVTGLTGAAPIWHQFVRTVLNGEPEKDFTRPAGLIEVEVCSLSGELPTDDCEYRRRDWFIPGTEPTEPDTFYKRVIIDSATGLLADSTTPPERHVEQIVLNLPPTLQPWARAHGLTLYADLLAVAGTEVATGSPGANAPLVLLSPQPNTRYRLSKELPADTQQLLIQAGGPSGLSQVTLWLDDTPIATFDAPPFETFWPLHTGAHRAWAEGVNANGSPTKSETVTFTVSP